MTRQGNSPTLGELLEPFAQRCEQDLGRWLIEPGVPGTLAEAMRYCTLGGGKRLRPALVHMAAEACGRTGDDLTARAAAAIELVHCCSLVHDDLPAMDDDTLRRGRPTAHVKFGQAMAILVGDALLTRAFGLLAEADDRRSVRLTCELAQAAGAAGMVAGQVADMDLCQLPEGLEEIRFIHLRKTAAMLRAAARMGAICADADDKTVDALGDYAEAIGLAFQLFDDLLDVTGAAETIGKTPGKDADADKRTAAAQLGLDGARKLGNELTDRAIASLKPLGEKADTLICLTRLLALRTH